MNGQQELEYIGREEQFLIGVAMERLVKALTDEKRYAASNIGQAINTLTEVIHNLNPIGEWNEDEAELSMSLHTWLRKYDDSHLSSILYSYIKEDRARTVWMTFVKDLLVNHQSKRYSLHVLDKLNLSTTDEYAMRHLLKMWKESGGLDRAIKDMLEWESLKPHVKPEKKNKNIV
jgi:hypothetical protein